MPLPEFDRRGLFPEGVYPGSQAELRERCVLGFPESVRRRLILDGLLRYQAAIAALGLNVTQWVNGSFLDRTRLNPDDVDVVNFLDSAELNALPLGAQAEAGLLLGGESVTKQEYHVHSFLELLFHQPHGYAANFEVRRKEYRNAWSSPLDYSGPKKKLAPWRGRKGFVRMTVGDAKLCLWISDLP